MVIAGFQLHLAPLALLLTTHRSVKMQEWAMINEGRGNDDSVGRVGKDSTANIVKYVINESIGQDELNCNSHDQRYEEGCMVLNTEDTSMPKPESIDQLIQLDSTHDNSVEEERAAVRLSISRNASVHANGLMTSCVQSTGLSLLWENQVYALFLPVALLSGTIFGTFLAHAASVAIFNGIAALEAAFLISVVGITNMISRVAHGLLLKTGVIHQAILYALANAIGALSVLVMPSTSSYAVMIVCAAGVGLGSGTYIPLQLVIIRQMIPIHRFPGGVGMTLFSVCIGIMMSSAVSGEKC